MKHVESSCSFTQIGEFAAVRAAEAWCEVRGISVGSMERDSPRGLLYGDYAIAKWRNLTAGERFELDGTMVGDMRRGPVKVELWHVPHLTPTPGATGQVDAEQTKP